MSDLDPRSARRDPRERTRRELDRYQRREGPGAWRALALIGSVGWPIVLLALGGAWLGRYLDARLHSGIKCTFALLSLGVVLGCVSVYRSLRKDDP